MYNQCPTLQKADSDNKVQWSGRRTHLPLVYLALMTRADGKNAVLKDRGPEVARTKDLLGSGISKHVATTGARVAVIQNTLSFLES